MEIQYFKDFPSVMTYYRPYHDRDSLVVVSKEKIKQGFAVIGEPPKVRKCEWFLNKVGQYYIQEKKPERSRYSKRDTRPDIRLRKIEEGLLPIGVIHS